MLVDHLSLYSKTHNHRCSICGKYIYKHELDKTAITKTKRKNIVITHLECLGGPNANTSH